MAKLRWYNGNQGIFRYDDFEDFDVINVNKNRALLEYNGNDGPFDPTRQPYSIRLIFDNAKTTASPSGDGSTWFSSGKVVGIKYYNQAGQLIMEVTDINKSLKLLQAMYSVGNTGDIFDYLVNGNNTYTGSNDASGPQQGWTGDDIKTWKGNDIVKAKAGDDYIKDQGGKDNYNGGAGWDTVTYDNVFWSPDDFTTIQGIVARLDKGKITGFDGHVDKVKSIEEVRGTYLNDTFVGNNKDNWFQGFMGNDKFNGKGGRDGVSYRNDEDQGGYFGIKANLKKGVVIDGFGDRDKLKNIENVDGTDYDDKFVDNNNDNYLRGRDGDDMFCITGGNDYIRTGEGADEIIFKGSNFGSNTIEDFEDGVDKLRIENANFSDLNISQDGSDTLIEYNGNFVRLDDFTATDFTQNDLF